jgi:hypothetical protein
MQVYPDCASLQLALRAENCLDALGQSIQKPKPAIVPGLSVF